MSHASIDTSAPLPVSYPSPGLVHQSHDFVSAHLLGLHWSVSAQRSIAMGDETGTAADHSTWVRFRAGLKAQNLLDGHLPVRGKLQPYAGWLALISALVTLIFW